MLFLFGRCRMYNCTMIRDKVDEKNDARDDDKDSFITQCYEISKELKDWDVEKEMQIFEIYYNWDSSAYFLLIRLFKVDCLLTNVNDSINFFLMTCFIDSGDFLFGRVNKN